MYFDESLVPRVFDDTAVMIPSFTVTVISTLSSPAGERYDMISVLVKGEPCSFPDAVTGLYPVFIDPVDSGGAVGVMTIPVVSRIGVMTTVDPDVSICIEPVDPVKVRDGVVFEVMEHALRVLIVASITSGAITQFLIEKMVKK